MRAPAGAMAVAVCSALLMTVTAQDARAQAAESAQPEKKPKDRAEYDLYNEVIKDNSNPAKLLQDLDSWTQKYPETDFKDDRAFFYISAYNGTNQPAKVVDTAAQLLAKDLNAAFKAPQQVIAVLYLTALNVQKTPNPNGDQLATGQKAARQLLDFTPTYFTAANKPAATTEAQWGEARSQLGTVAKGALAYIAMVPGNVAMAPNPKDPNNCAAGE